MKQASFWQSIQWKLPALMAVVLLLVVSSLTYLSYRALERTLLDTAQTRLAGAARILGDALRPGLEGRVKAMSQVATRPEMARLVGRADTATTVVTAAFRASPPGAGAGLELHDARGGCVASYGKDSVTALGSGCLPWPSLAGSARPLPILVVADTARLGVSAPVRAPGADSIAQPIGWVVERRPFSSAAGTQLIAGLIGSDARLYFANADGSVWTDLSKPVPAPFPSGPDQGLRTYEREGEERLAIAQPLAGTPYQLAVEFPRATVLAPAHEFLRRALLAALLLLALGCAAAWLVSRRIGQPLIEATAAAEAVAAGELGNRVSVSREDEVGRFAAAFNTMAEQVERHQRELEGLVERRTLQLKDTLRELRGAQDELVRKEKLATLGQLASSVGHELRNPLGVMSNAVYFLKMVQKDAPKTVSEYLDILKQQIVLSEKIVSDLLDFSRVKPPQTETVAVSDLVKGQLDRVGHPEGIEIVTAMPAGVAPVRVDRVQIGQVLFNLLTNAVQAMEQGGTLGVRATQVDGAVQLAVADTGVGIPPDKLEAIFDPLFTTKARGIGLGLSVARSLARANRGDITVTSEPGQGSTFVLTLPSADASSAA